MRRFLMTVAVLLWIVALIVTLVILSTNTTLGRLAFGLVVFVMVATTAYQIAQDM